MPTESQWVVSEWSPKPFCEQGLRTLNNPKGEMGPRSPGSLTACGPVFSLGDGLPGRMSVGQRAPGGNWEVG